MSPSPPDPNEQREASREAWERAATGWGLRADRIRDWGMPVSAAMVDALALQPGQRVLELAAGPGDTGFLAAELVSPGGTLISSDGAPAMVEVARRRAQQFGMRNVEFAHLELEWIDLETASVDAVLCRWGIMLIVDPEAAAREIRRVLRPSGRAAFAVWGQPRSNPWATIPAQAMIAEGHAQPPDPDAPGMFRFAEPGTLQGLLESTGFTDVVVAPQDLTRHYDEPSQFVQETMEISPMFSATFPSLSAEQQQSLTGAISAALEAYTASDGSVTLPGRSLVAVATA